MAYATGDLNGSGPFYVGLDIWVGAQDTPGNQSRFDWVLYIGCTSNGWGTWAGNAQYWSTNIAGVGYSGTFTLDFRPSGSSGRRYAIASGSTWVGHNADGTRPGFPNYGSIDTDHSSVGDGTATTWVDAPTIARATQPTLSASSFDAGTAVTINTPRASGSFTHTLKYSFGSATGTIATGVATSQSWTPPLSLLSQIPNAASGTGTITCETYSGATLIGTKTVGFTLTAGSAIVPDFTTVTSSETVTAVSTNVGAYVQNLSKLALAITGAAGVYGSTIASYKIEVAGQTINSASGTTPAVISASGTVPIVGTITDSRGRTKSKTVNVTVLPYTPPVITSLDVVRATSGGTPNPDGTYLKLTMNAAVQSLMNGTQKNLLTYQVWTRPMGTTTWVSKGSWTSGIAFNSSRTIGTGGEYSIGSSYEMQITVSDRFNSITAIRSTATTAVPFDISATGTGHGKVHERGALDVGGDGYFTGKVEVDGNLIVDGTVSFGGVVFSPSSWMRGTTAQRDAFFGTPTTDAARAALANLQPVWYNTTTGRQETYYALASISGLTVPGLASFLTSGWYAMPATEWAGKSGPSSYIAAYKCGWARGIASAGSTLDATTSTSQVKIGIDGIYECHSYLRGGASGNAAYSGLGLDGDRAAFELRSNPTSGPMLGLWTHDHPAATNNFTVSHYLGQLYAGDLITAGPYTSGTDIALSSAASSGMLSVRRIS